jgi:hypothetical protein
LRHDPYFCEFDMQGNQGAGEMREEFEKAFPVPHGVYWRTSSEKYSGNYSHRDAAADEHTRKLEVWQAATALQAGEIERLTQCLAKANAQAEHFEREWYLRGDEIERQAERARELEEALQAVLECGSTSDQWWVDKARKALSATAREVGK